jgi:hypothetical protein
VSLGIDRSTNRKNTVLRASATNDFCDTSKGDPEETPFASRQTRRKSDDRFVSF